MSKSKNNLKKHPDSKFIKRSYLGQSIVKATSNPFQVWEKYRFDRAITEAKLDHAVRYQPTLENIVQAENLKVRQHIATVSADYGHATKKDTAHNVVSCIDKNLTDSQCKVLSNFVTELDVHVNELACAKGAKESSSELYKLQREFIENIKLHKLSYYRAEINNALDGVGATVNDCTSIISNQITPANVPRMMDIITMLEINPIIASMTLDYTPNICTRVCSVL